MFIHKELDYAEDNHSNRGNNNGNVHKIMLNNGISTGMMCKENHSISSEVITCPIAFVPAPPPTKVKTPAVFKVPASVLATPPD